MSGLERAVVVGASLAGLRAAETLRSRGFEGDVTVVGAESHRPYDRPPLSKKLLAGEWEPERIALRRPDTFDELDVTWTLGVAATGLAPDVGIVHLSDGSVLAADGVVVATGATPRRLPEQGRFDHVHELRTLDDAMRLRTRLGSGTRRVVVIGAGFIGLEVAATARGLGHDVMVLEGADAPLVRGCGAEMGRAIGDLHAVEGVDIRCGVEVSGLDERGVRIGSNELVEADVVVVGIGVVPSTSWLAGSGLEVRDGVVCDETLRAARNEPGAAMAVYAAGDVARWPNQLFDEEMRIEHWTNAAEQGASAATNLLAAAGGGIGEAYAPVPFVWSDQFDHRLQFLGRAGPADDVVVAAGDVADGRWLALYGRQGRLRGALGVNAPRWVMPMRGLLADRCSWEDALDHAAAL